MIFFSTQRTSLAISCGRIYLQHKNENLSIILPLNISLPYVMVSTKSLKIDIYDTSVDPKLMISSHSSTW